MLLRRTIATIVCAALAALAGCDGDAPETGAATSAPSTTALSPSPADAPVPTYVALGDSYTAAPGVPETEQTACLRSSGNYPHVVAAALGRGLVDVSCSGATTTSLTEAQGTQPPQLDALSPATSLVTLGIGGNDLDRFVTLIGVCAQLGVQTPTGSPCQDQMTAGGTQPDQLVEKVAEIGGRVASALHAVHDRAPDATVLLVGYPQPVPATGTCDILPLAEGDYPYVRSVAADLDDALRAAARQGHATYVDVARPSRGHDICAGDQAWVNGIATDPARALAFHPFAQEQQAVADLVVAALS